MVVCCGKKASDFAQRSSFNTHRKACCAKQNTDKVFEADGSNNSHATPISSDAYDILPLRNEQEQLSSGFQNVLKNKFVSADHSVPPELNFTRKEVPKVPKASDVKAWSEVNKILDDSLAAIDSIVHSKTLDIHFVVEKFESRMYDTLVHHCGVHSPSQRDIPCRAKPNQPSKRELRAKAEKASLKRQCKAALKGKVQISQHEKKQLMRKWRLMSKTRRQLRIERENKDVARKTANARRKFRADPYKFAQELFDPPNKSAPTFDVQTAHTHFVKTNSDAHRSVVLEPMPGWIRPPSPRIKFDESVPTAEQLADAVRGKRTKCSPGMNGITYLVYKKCPAAMSRLLVIIQRVWKEKEIPRSWQCGFVILIPKASTTNLSDPSEFRPIALINVEGRLLFTLMEWRLSNFMIKNGYMDSSLQKGFMREVGGCVEHSETVYRAALDARKNKRDFVVSWIGLANAYRSVKHSLIQFSLEWYHVPDHFCELMWKYYEKLAAAVLVNGELTPWFWFEVGVFQGCTVSTILFNVAFNTSFMHLQPLEAKCAYVFHSQKISVTQTG